MKSTGLFLSCLLFFAAAHAQSIGLRAACSYRLLGNAVRTRNAMSYTAGAYWDAAFGKSRLGLSAGLYYSRINTAADKDNLVIDRPGYGSGYLSGQSCRYHALEVPLMISIRVAGSSRRGSGLHLTGGFACTWLMSGVTQTDYIDNSLYQSEVYYLPRQGLRASTMAGAEYRHRLQNNFVFAGGLHYRHYFGDIDWRAPFNETALYIKIGWRYKR